MIARLSHPSRGSKLWTLFFRDTLLEESICVTTSSSSLKDLGRLPCSQHARQLETWINSHIEGFDIESHYAACPYQWSTPTNT